MLPNMIVLEDPNLVLAKLVILEDPSLFSKSVPVFEASELTPVKEFSDSTPDFVHLSSSQNLLQSVNPQFSPVCEYSVYSRVQSSPGAIRICSSL